MTENVGAKILTAFTWGPFLFREADLADGCPSKATQKRKFYQNLFHDGVFYRIPDKLVMRWVEDGKILQQHALNSTEVTPEGFDGDATQPILLSMTGEVKAKKSPFSWPMETGAKIDLKAGQITDLAGNPLTPSAPPPASTEPTATPATATPAAETPAASSAPSGFGSGRGKVGSSK